MPQFGQPYRSENMLRLHRQVVSCRFTSTTPSASLSAVSIESVRRPRSSARTTSRSTTTEIVVILRAIELRRVGELDQLAIDVRADEALLARVLEQIAELALAAAHERREHLDARARAAR